MKQRCCLLFVKFTKGNFDSIIDTVLLIEQLSTTKISQSSFFIGKRS